MDLSIDVDVSAVLNMLEAYPKQVERASVRALNRAGTAMKTAMSREVSKDIGLKTGDVKKQISLRKAALGRFFVELAASLKRIPLIKFGARGTKKGVTYKLRGGRGRAPHGFIIQRWKGVFERAPGAGRGPVQQLHGPSVGHVFAKHAPAGLARAQEQFTKSLDHELSRIGGGA